MEIFVGPNLRVLDALTDAETLVKSAPEMADRFEALKELRGQDDGSLYRGSAFRRVASLSGPLLDFAEILEPGFLDKKFFYAWLDRHQEYCTYDRRPRRKRSDLVTFQDGKEV